MRILSSLADALASKFLTPATVLAKAPLADKAYHLTLRGEKLHHLPYVPGQHLRLYLGQGEPTSLQEKVRTYSVWHYDPVAGDLELAVCAHSPGPGSAWVRAVQPGQQVYLSSFQGKFTLDTSADSYLFIGDASALAHLYELRRHLAPGQAWRGLVYADSPAELFADLDGQQPFELRPLPTNPLPQLRAWLESVLPALPVNTIAYIGGDGRVCIELTNYFRRVQGWEHKRIKAKPFWLPGRTGLE